MPAAEFESTSPVLEWYRTIRALHRVTTGIGKKVPRHEGVWGSGGIAPCVNLDTKCR